jgi:hypothetical protein
MEVLVMREKFFEFWEDFVFDHVWNDDTGMSERTNVKADFINLAFWFIVLVIFGISKFF